MALSEIPSFSGENLSEWISEMETFMELFEIPTAQLVNFAHMYVYGSAGEWVNSNIDKICWMDWFEFVQALRTEFGESKDELEEEQEPLDKTMDEDVLEEKILAAKSILIGELSPLSEGSEASGELAYELRSADLAQSSRFDRNICFSGETVNEDIHQIGFIIGKTFDPGTEMATDGCNLDSSTSPTISSLSAPFPLLAAGMLRYFRMNYALHLFDKKLKRDLEVESLHFLYWLCPKNFVYSYMHADAMRKIRMTNFTGTSSVLQGGPLITIRVERVRLSAVLLTHVTIGREAAYTQKCTYYTSTGVSKLLANFLAVFSNKKLHDRQIHTTMFSLVVATGTWGLHPMYQSFTLSFSLSWIAWMLWLRGSSSRISDGEGVANCNVGSRANDSFWITHDELGNNRATKKIFSEQNEMIYKFISLIQAAPLLLKPLKNHASLIVQISNTTLAFLLLECKLLYHAKVWNTKYPGIAVVPVPTQFKVSQDQAAKDDSDPTVVGLHIWWILHYQTSYSVTCGLGKSKTSTEWDKLALAIAEDTLLTCWKSYIRISISDGPGYLRMHCPSPKCVATVTQAMIDTQGSDEDKEKYSRYLLRSYVESSRKTKWCPAPAPGCDYAVEFVIGSDNYDVSCKCTHSFCWNGLEDAHRPVEWDTVAKWVMKNKAEAENTTWIIANTKPSPKCKRSIEKNEGCMHMTCTPPCNYEFCWLATGPEVTCELKYLLKLRILCWHFSKKPFSLFLEETGYSQEDVLLQEAKAGILRPASTVLADKRVKCFYLLIWGTHSIKDTLTAATGAIVPFHHTVVREGGVSDSILGYAHCGMVAAARWMAKLASPCLIKAPCEHTDYKLKIVGHSLGGGTAALLTYALRAQQEFATATGVAFAPAACMTWELAESGKSFITSVVNGADLVPTFSAASVDDLRSEVTASAWLNDLRTHIEHTRILRTVYRSTSRLPSIASARQEDLMTEVELWQPIEQELHRQPEYSCCLCADVMERILAACYNALSDHHVDPGIPIIKVHWSSYIVLSVVNRVVTRIGSWIHDPGSVKVNASAHDAAPDALPFDISCSAIGVIPRICSDLSVETVEVRASTCRFQGILYGVIVAVWAHGVGPFGVSFTWLLLLLTVQVADGMVRGDL